MKERLVSTDKLAEMIQRYVTAYNRTAAALNVSAEITAVVEMCLQESFVDYEEMEFKNHMKKLIFPGAKT